MMWITFLQVDLVGPLIDIKSILEINFLNC